MRVLKPNPGELADRQSILTLKVEHVQSQKDYDNDEKQVTSGAVARTVVSNPTKVNVHPFVDELEGIRAHLLKHWMTDLNEESGKLYDQYFDELYDVNSKLWDLEDEARTLRDAPDKFKPEACRRAAEVLFTINDLNDGRAGLVKQINKLWKIDSQEKIYQ